MTSTHRQIAEDFSSHRFDAVFPYLADDVRWNLVGADPLLGKAAVVAACERSAGELAAVTVSYERFKVVAGDDSVAVDTIARYRDQDDDETVVSSCDIYEFTGTVLTTITSYAVDVDS